MAQKRPDHDESSTEEVSRLRARIAQLEAAERGLREAQERFRIVAGQTGQVLYDYDIASGRIAWDGAIEAMTGHSREEFRQVDIAGWEERIHPDDRATVMQIVGEVMRNPRPYRAEYRFRHKLGHYTVVEDSGVFVSGGEGAPARLLGTMRDISQRRKVEQALEESAARYRAIFEGTSEGIMIAEVQSTRFIYANPAACRMLGYEESEIRGQPIAFIHPEADLPHVRSEFDAQARGEKQLALEVPCRRKDGSVFLADVNTALAVIDGRPCNIGFFTDLTPRHRAEEERRRLEAQMQQTQKLESLGLLAGGVAHDFNNLLLAVLGNAELASRSLHQETAAKSHLDAIVLASHRAADLCRQLLAYAGRGKVQLVPVDLNEAILETTRLLQVSISKKIDLQYDLAETLPAVEADPGQIRQILMNLVLNASEAIGERSGVIRITTARFAWTGSSTEPRRWMPAAPEIGDYVALSVNDDGCGMDADTLERIFDPFFTTKFTGRGLGLAAAFGIVRAHQGALSVQSSPGQGTVFTILVPASANRLAHSRDDSSQVAWQGAGRVLLVDDEEVVLDVGKGMLEHLGFSVVLAATGRQAIEVLRGDPSSFVCAILDVMMPEMGGDEALVALLDIRPDLPVIVASGYGREEIARRFPQGAVACYLQKPYAIPELQRALRAMLPRT